MAKRQYTIVRNYVTPAGKVTLKLDFEAIVNEMAAGAIRSKGGRLTRMHGAVVVLRGFKG